MTFILKDYNALIERFEETIKLILLRDKKETVEQLDNPRRDQIKFLQYIVSDIRTELARPKTRSPSLDAGYHSNITNVLYGAMSLISTIITDSVYRGSTLRDSLDFGMGINTKEKPSNAQYRECYAQLNYYLNRIFINKDSRLGIRKDHSLRYIPEETIIEFVKKSYELEASYEKKTLDTYAIDGNSVTSITDYRKTKKIPDNLLTINNDWETLKAQLASLIRQELADKDLADISLLPKERAAQLGFLHTIAKTLPTTKVTPIERTAILAGAMHIIREQIGQEYGLALLDKRDTSSVLQAGSVIHAGLTVILDAKNNSPENIEALVQAANHFIMAVTTVSDKFRAQHLFSTMAHSDLLSLLTLSQNIIKTCRLVALDAAVKRASEAMETDAATKKPAYGIANALGTMLFGPGTSPTESNEPAAASQSAPTLATTAP